MNAILFLAFVCSTDDPLPLRVLDPAPLRARRVPQAEPEATPATMTVPGYWSSVPAGRFGLRTSMEWVPAREIVRQATPAATGGASGDALAKWLAQPMHVGTCPCQRTGGCHCVPASECGAGRCVQHNPLLNGQASKPVPAPALPSFRSQ